MSRYKLEQLMNNAFQEQLKVLDVYAWYFSSPLALNNKNMKMTNIRQLVSRKLNKMGLTLDEIAYILSMKNHTSIIHLLNNRKEYDLSEEEANLQEIITTQIYPVLSSDKKKYVWVKQYKFEDDGSERVEKE
jgi:hypothetical protein